MEIGIIIFSTVWVLLMLMILAYDKKWLAYVISCIALGLVIGKMGLDLEALKHLDYLQIGERALYWLGIGLVFSFFKWKMHTLKVGDKLREMIAETNLQALGEAAYQNSLGKNLKNGVVTERATSQDIDTAELARERAIDDARDRIARSANSFSMLMSITNQSGVWKFDYNKSRLTEYVTNWTIWWPFYATLLVFDDIITKLATWFVDFFGGMFRRIMLSSFKGIE